MQISVGWLARIAATVRALFQRPVKTTELILEAPSVDGALHADARQANKPLPRMLSARIACQSRLNVPVGKKPRIAKVVAAKTATRRPKTIVVTKTAPKMRDVYLPAKHLASKSRPQTRSNVITLPVHAKSNKTLVKAPIVKLHKLAA